jgi:hypothetical protein
MIYEVINPSDCVTFEADELKLAQAACLMVGQGQYGLENEESEDVLPILVFGDPEPWLKDNGLHPISEFIDDYAAEIAEVLRTFMCCGISDRRAALKIIDMATDKQKALDVWNDEHRTSLNNICARAYALADSLEKKR